MLLQKPCVNTFVGEKPSCLTIVVRINNVMYCLYDCIFALFRLCIHNQRFYGFSEILSL